MINISSTRWVVSVVLSDLWTGTILDILFEMLCIGICTDGFIDTLLGIAFDVLLDVTVNVLARVIIGDDADMLNDAEIIAVAAAAIAFLGLDLSCCVCRVGFRFGFLIERSSRKHFADQEE